MWVICFEFTSPKKEIAVSLGSSFWILEYIKFFKAVLLVTCPLATLKFQLSGPARWPRG